MEWQIGQPMKWCSDCGSFKPHSEFTADRRRQDGLACYCKPWARLRRQGSRDARPGAHPAYRYPRDVEVVDGHKWRPDRDSVKPFAEFPRIRAHRSRYAAYCKPSHNARGGASKERVGGSRTYHVRRRYGLSAQGVDARVAEQKGPCAICREVPAEHVDHDHETGRVRGILASTATAASASSGTGTTC